MKAISLWQPWASLWLASRDDVRFKLHETRHWHIKDQWRDWRPGTRMAVHAAKRFEKDHDPIFASVLRMAFGADWYRTLPVGALIGSIDVTGCFPTATLHDLTDDDEICGNFEPGRWAWRGEKPILLPKPVQWKGAQGIFNVPDEMFSIPAAA